MISKSQALADALSRTTAFASGCPFAVPSGKRGDAKLLEILGTVPEPALSQLKLLLIKDASALRNSLGIDGGSWDSVLLGVTGNDKSPEATRASAPARAPGSLTIVDAGTALPLSRQLKEGTKTIHKAAENVHFVREFIKGRCPRDVYAMMIRDLYHVYRALEANAEACASDPSFGPIHAPYELGRTAALEADMAALFGPGWRTDERCRPSAAATAYVARLDEVAATSPALLVAHSYTRYLGDLSGGRVLMRIARKLLGLDGSSHDGVRFYVFERVPDAKAFKAQYRERLDALSLPPGEAQRIVAEAERAFELNIGLFHELDRHLPARQPASTPTTSARASDGAAAGEKLPAGCPFAKLAAEPGSPVYGMKCQRVSAAEVRLGRERATARGALALLVGFLALCVACLQNSS